MNADKGHGERWKKATVASRGVKELTLRLTAVPFVRLQAMLTW
jgi:hypothetical protein